MPVYLAFLFYFVACMLLSALLLPWVQPWFHAWFDATPDRSLYRFGMLLTAAGLPFFLKILRLRDRVSIGWLPPPNGARVPLATGLLLGSAMLFVVVLALMAFGVRYLKPSDILVQTVLAAALSGLASGLVVGLLEEFFFRGPLQGGMRRTLGFWSSVLLIAPFYSVVHFIRPTPLAGDTLDIGSSLLMLWGGLQQLAGFASIADSFFTLVLAGILLSMIRERTGSLFLAIGVHAGWVMIIRVTKGVTETDHTSEWVWLIGSYDNVTGWMASLVIALSAAAYWRFTRARTAW